MKTEKAIFRPSSEHATPQGVADFFSEVFAALAERPRRVTAVLDFSEASVTELMVLDVEKGEPVFRQDGHNAAHGKLQGRWLAEHDAPLTLSLPLARLRLVPTSGGRIRVRKA